MCIIRSITIIKKAHNSLVRIVLMSLFSAQRAGKGFTLLELIIVVFFLALLAVIAIPSFIKQVGKARESEVKNAVGSVNRAQQAYHWEKATFAQGINDEESLKLLNLSIGNRYIDSFSIVGNPISATIAPANLNFELDQTKAYSGGVYYANGLYEVILCVSLDPVVSISPPINANSCGANLIIQ